MSDRLNGSATWILVACAIIVTVLVVTVLVARRELFHPQAVPAGEPPVRNIDHWKRLIIAGHLIGPATAPVKIVKFADFECPFCAEVRPDLEGLVTRYPGRVAVLFRQFPVTSIHPYAYAAAEAAECAASQGMFIPVHDALFQAQDTLGKVNWTRLALMAGVRDTARFSRCVRSPDADSAIARDVAAARGVGVEATPTFIFRGRLVVGTSGFEVLEQWLRDSLSFVASR